MKNYLNSITPALFMQKIKDKSRSEAKTQSQSPERSEGEAWGKR